MTFDDWELVTIIQALKFCEEQNKVLSLSPIEMKIEEVRSNSVSKRYSLHDVDWLIENGKKGGRKARKKAELGGLL